MSGFAGTQGIPKPISLLELPSQGTSIGIAMISHKAAVVCSDRLVYFPVPSAFRMADFDKTFSAGKWIGVCTGVMDLSGNTPQTVADILQKDPSRTNLMQECRKLLDAHTCLPEERHIEILLAGLSTDGPTCHRIVLHLDAKNDTVKEFPLNTRSARSHVLIGEEKARKEADHWIVSFGNFERASKMSACHMKKLVEDAVRAGIAKCGDHPSLSGCKACGGKPFSRTIDFKPMSLYSEG